MHERLRIAVVGGSISGCSAAIALGRSGHEVTVFERSHGELTGRGAGIGTPITMLHALVERDLISADMPYFEVVYQPFVGSAPDQERLGHTAWKSPIRIALLNWGDLWRQLRARVPDTVYRSGTAVGDVRMVDAGKAEVSLVDGGSEQFDLVIFADGYFSMGRPKLCPDSRPSYCGYVLWRGVLEEKDLGDSEPLEGMLPRIGYRTMPGHAVMYFVPGHGGSIKKGARWVNWACYVPLTEEELPAFLVDRRGHRHAGSLPPGSMRPEEESRLKALMNSQMPAYYADIIVNSHDTFAQPIYLVEVPAYHRDRLCLMGDAGSLAQPFTGSGVFKGAHNAIDLAEALTRADTVDDALETWGSAQTETGRKLAALGRQMEKAFIWDAPDFGRMDGETASAWWKAAVTFPDNFTYAAKRDEGGSKT